MNPHNTSPITKFVLHFNKFMSMFSSNFTAHHRDVFPAASSYVEGLVQQIPRKNIERINEHVPDFKYDSHHCVISDSPWSPQALNHHIAQQANDLIGGESSILTVDESAFSKAGNESAGVARQYNGRLGKLDNCQVGVFATLSRKEERAIIGSRLFLPQKWTRNARRCKKAGIPKDERQYKTKPQLALELVDEAREAKVKFGMVTGDAVYGSSEFAHALDERRIPFSLDIRSNQRVYLNDPKPYIPQRKANRGRSRSVLKTDESSIAVSTLAKRIKKHQWGRIEVWKGTKGFIRVDAFAMRVYFWNAQYDYAPVQWWLVMIREQGSKEIEFFISNESATMPLKTLVAKHRNRYWIERCFQDSKSTIGMADYQVRKWQGWHHHMSLCMLALLFMLTLKDINRRDMPMLSCEDVVQVMHFYLSKRIVTEQDLVNVINKRHEKRLKAEKSALRCQKRRDRLKSKVPK